MPEKEYRLELYTEEELELLEQHIFQYFGAYESVLHEIVSPDIHVDICIISPTEERNYYVLVTTGMGAHRMNVPEALKEQKLEQAELVLCLPPDWKINENDETWYWPFRLMKSLARLPIECDTWLGWGHTAEDEEPYAENTKLCGALLLEPFAFDEEAVCCPLSEDAEVNFYQLLPLYREEMEYKRAHGTEALLEKMGRVKAVVDIDRKNCCI